VTETPDAFALPDRRAAKADPALIEADERHFTAITASLERSIAELSARLDTELRAPGGAGQEAMDRDLEVHRLSQRLRALRRFGLDLTLGRMVADGEPTYVGRFGVTDSDGARLLLDWRSPAAEPFFGATHANPMGLESRRRYRWTRRRVTDYWDEVSTADGLENSAALDDQSAFIASLGSSRSPQMRDVLSTIQADQDAIIRAPSRGALVVDGGPGTGKTVVALHRTAYLLYSDPRLAQSMGGVLFVGPHSAYLAYVADVLPSLGEEGVQTCTVRDLVAEGAHAIDEPDPVVAGLKADARIVASIEAAVSHYERIPTGSMTVETPWADVELDQSDWVEAFGAAEEGVSHNDARDLVWDALVEIIADRHSEDAPPHLVRRTLAHDDELRSAFAKAWPLLDPAGVVRDLLTVPAYLHQCAPWLEPSEVMALQRDFDSPWTSSDLPLLDAARLRIGDPTASRERRRREAVTALERERRASVVDDLIAADDSDLMLMSMLRGEDAQNSLDDDAVLPTVNPDLLAGPFAHVVVDEAQELTDAEWQMLLARCPSGSFTIVGDRAQARHGFTETWEERLRRVGIGQITMAGLTVNYRTPSEVMAEAEPVIRAVLPDANVPTSIRSSGVAVLHGDRADLEAILYDWLASHDDGVACVIGDAGFESRPRVRSLTPVTAKGLEFDLVVLVDPESFGQGIEGAVDRYVAMTRATERLVMLS
jgi:DNA helicase IV